MRRILHKIIDSFFEHSLLISSISIILLSVIDISNINDWKLSKWGLVDFPIGKYFYGFLVVVCLIFAFFSISSSKNISTLEKETLEKSNKINDLENALTESVKQMNDLFNSYLMLLVESLDFGHTERISVYKIFESSFVLIGRSSKNPNLKKMGRSNYPLDEGFISKGWSEGEFFIDNLPDPNTNKVQYYTSVNNISKIDRAVVNNLNMKSRTYFIFRINGYNNNPKAILVFESLNPSNFIRQDIVDKLEGVKQPLVMFIENNNGVKLQNNNDLGL